MDTWQKLEVLSKVVAAVLIPVAVAYLGNQVAVSNKQRDSEVKFVELATAILRQEPIANQSEDAASLRQWAVAVIDRFSGVPMPSSTAKALIQSTALPMVEAGAAPAAAAIDPSGTWGVVFGGDVSLEAAQHEVTVTAARMEIGASQIFRRAGSFRSVKVYVSRAEAEQGLSKARALREDAYIVNMALWCPSSEARDGYFECRL